MAKIRSLENGINNLSSKLISHSGIEFGYEGTSKSQSDIYIGGLNNNTYILGDLINKRVISDQDNDPPYRFSDNTNWYLRSDGTGFINELSTDSLVVNNNFSSDSVDTKSIITNTIRADNSMSAYSINVRDVNGTGITIGTNSDEDKILELSNKSILFYSKQMGMWISDGDKLYIGKDTSNCTAYIHLDDSNSNMSIYAENSIDMYGESSIKISSAGDTNIDSGSKLKLKINSDNKVELSSNQTKIRHSSGYNITITNDSSLGNIIKAAGNNHTAILLDSDGWTTPYMLHFNYTNASNGWQQIIDFNDTMTFGFFFRQYDSTYELQLTNDDRNTVLYLDKLQTSGRIYAKNGIELGSKASQAGELYFYNSGSSNTGYIKVVGAVSGSTTSTVTIPQVNATLATYQRTSYSPKWLNVNNELTFGASGFQYFSLNGTAQTGTTGTASTDDAKTNNTPTSAWYHILRMNYSGSTGYFGDLALSINDSGGLYWRRVTNGSSFGWVRTLDQNGGTLFDGKYLKRTGKSASWYNGRDSAMIIQSSIDSYSPMLSAKTSNGSWEFGPYTNNSMWLSYITDTNYSAKTNTQTAKYSFGADGNLTAAKFTGALAGNASTATKLAAARTITLSNDLDGSVSFDGSGNVTLNASIYSCTAAVNNTNNYPYHRIAKLDTITASYADRCALLYITADYDGGIFGIIKIALRTNNSSSVSSATARWLVRSSNMAVDAIQIGIYNVYGSTYADVFYKSANAYASISVRALEGQRASITRTWTLVNSTEVNNTTSSDKLTSTEVYASIASAGTELHSQAYSSINTASDCGTVGSISVPSGSSDKILTSTGSASEWRNTAKLVSVTTKDLYGNEGLNLHASNMQFEIGSNSNSYIKVPENVSGQFVVGAIDGKFCGVGIDQSTYGSQTLTSYDDDNDNDMQDATLWLGDPDNSAYVVFVEDVLGGEIDTSPNDESGSGVFDKYWSISNNGSARFRNNTISTLKTYNIPIIDNGNGTMSNVNSYYKPDYQYTDPTFRLITTSTDTILSIGDSYSSSMNNSSATGKLRLYGSYTGYTDIQTKAYGSNNTLSLPSSTGTLAITSDIPGVNGKDAGKTSTIYAPTTYGSNGYVLISNGMDKAPTWTSMVHITGDELYLDSGSSGGNSYLHGFNNVTISTFTYDVILKANRHISLTSLTGSIDINSAGSVKIACEDVIDIDAASTITIDSTGGTINIDSTESNVSITAASGISLNNSDGQLSLLSQGIAGCIDIRSAYNTILYSSHGSINLTTVENGIYINSGDDFTLDTTNDMTFSSTGNIILAADYDSVKLESGKASVSCVNANSGVNLYGTEINITGSGGFVNINSDNDITIKSNDGGVIISSENDIDINSVGVTNIKSPCNYDTYCTIPSYMITKTKPTSAYIDTMYLIVE